MKLQEIINSIKVWSTWVDSYKEYVPQFIQDAKTKDNWQDWNKDVFREYFERSNDQCVSSLKQGYYTNIEKEAIKKNWSELAVLLKKIADQQDQMDLATYADIKKWLGKYTSQNRKAAANRLIASLQPNLLCTIVNENSLRTLMQRINKLDTSAELKISWNWFENSNSILNYFKVNVPHENVYDIMTYPWQTYEILNRKKSTNNTNEMSEIDLENEISFLLKYKKQIILQGPPGTGKTREAKLIAKEMLGLNTVEDLNDNEQFKIIQFHPSYTYEDFVRGIVAKPNSDGEGILYEAENKTIGTFAKRAFENFVDSNKDVVAITREVKVKELFENFVEYVNDEIEKANGFYSLTDNVGLISSDDEYAFRYKGLKEGWLKNGNRILFKDILQSYFVGDSVRKDIKKNQKISGLARQHASYFVRVLNLFQKFIENENLENDTVNLNQKIDLKNYVLIIDEINRANLSSVLGELIYALEYRGEAVESMYDVEGKELILPQNLYIIGTMNTADRSVGHIDYAIRRRFAFVDILPKDLSDDSDVKFDSNLFLGVKELFTTDDYKTHSNNLSIEFDPKDVALGHSYFIQQYEKDKDGKDDKTKPYDFRLRLEYEIKPILLEYVKDGILVGNNIINKIESLETTI